MDQPTEIPTPETPKDKLADNYNFSPVSVTMPEIFGVFFLGLLSIFLFIELRRIQKKYDEILEKVQSSQ